VDGNACRTEQVASRALDDGDLLQVGFRYAFALTHHHHDAEDLVQAAWLKLNRRRRAVDTTRALLFTVIRNLHVDRYRRRQRVPFVSLDTCAVDAEQSEGRQEPLDEEIGRLLARLREAEREALFLHVVAGYSVDEIAKLTGRPRGTVLSLMHRGRRKLRALAETDEPARRP